MPLGMKWGGALFVLVVLQLPALAEDAYLDALEAEAARISGPQQVIQPGPGDATSEDVGGSDQRAIFEKLLRSRYKGTWSFYQSLPEKDKAEVLKAFQEGASMREIRRMIINRKMHR